MRLPKEEDIKYEFSLKFSDDDAGVMSAEVEGEIIYSGHPNMSYNKCYKDEQIKFFEIIR